MWPRPPFPPLSVRSGKKSGLGRSEYRYKVRIFIKVVEDERSINQNFYLWRGLENVVNLATGGDIFCMAYFYDGRGFCAV